MEFPAFWFQGIRWQAYLQSFEWVKTANPIPKPQKTFNPLILKGLLNNLRFLSQTQ
jgi:hypothetical protein